MKKILFSLLSFTIIFVLTQAHAGQLKMSTYYPSPTMTASEMKLVPRNDLETAGLPANCIVPTEVGRMFYLPNTGIVFCNKDGDWEVFASGEIGIPAPDCNTAGTCGTIICPGAGVSVCGCDPLQGFVCNEQCPMFPDCVEPPALPLPCNNQPENLVNCPEPVLPQGMSTTSIQGVYTALDQGPWVRFQNRNSDPLATTGVIRSVLENNRRVGLTFWTAPDVNSGGSVEQVRITGTGSLGIGTANPQNILHVQSKTAQGAMRLESTGGLQPGFSLMGYDSGIGAGIIQSYDDGSTSIPRNTVISPFGGRVGIGTDDPQGILDVNGGKALSGVSTTNITIKAQDAGGGAGSNIGGNILLLPGLKATNAGADGKVGIGTANPLDKLHLFDGNLRFGITSANTNMKDMVVEMLINPAALNFFAVDKGTNNVSMNNIMQIQSDGNVGIGVLNPQSKLHIKGGNNNTLQIDTTCTNGLCKPWDIYVSASTKLAGNINFGDLVFEREGIIDDAFVINRNGRINLREIKIRGAIIAGSSREIKKDIKVLSQEAYTDVLEEIMKADVVRYRYKSEPDDAKLHIGVIAEDAPDAIVDEDRKTVRLIDYSAFLLAGIKAQQEIIQKLQSDLSDMKTQQNDFMDMQKQIEILTQEVKKLKDKSTGVDGAL